MKVSVLLPTHERPRLLAEALDSLRQQTMPQADFEVIVANDDTARLPDGLMDGLYGRILQGPFGGQSAANNAALAVATGDYVTVAHDDDLVLPQKLAALSAALDAAGPDIVAVFGWPIYTDDEGMQIGCPPTVSGFMARHPVVTYADVEREGLQVHGTALLYRRSALESIGGWDDSLPTAEEFDLHLRLLKFAGDFRAVDVPVVTYRAGGKHTAYRRGKRPREIMRRIYDKLAIPVNATEGGD